MFKQRRLQATTRIVSVVVFGDRDETALLAMAASLALAVDDPLGAAILKTAPNSSSGLPRVEQIQSISERGVAGSVDGHVVVLGSSSFLAGVRQYQTAIRFYRQLILDTAGANATTSRATFLLDRYESCRSKQAG
jgi:cation transport ATPase